MAVECGGNTIGKGKSLVKREQKKRGKGEEGSGGMLDGIVGSKRGGTSKKKTVKEGDKLCAADEWK